VGPDQVTIDGQTAKKQHFAVGDKITIIGNTGPATYTLVGITKFGSTDNLAGATLVSFDLPTAQRVAGKPGYLSQIDVSAVPGTSSDHLLSVDREPAAQGLRGDNRGGGGRPAGVGGHQRALAVQHHPPGVRRRGPLRRRLPDLQHLQHPGRPAHP
jgi:hypothetical protein